MTARTQAPFRPVLLTVDPAVAVMGTLLDVKIGNMSQIWSAQPLSLTLFSPLHWASIDVMQEVVGRFKWGTANIAQDITLTVDLTLASYDPLIEEARKATGMPTPTKFRAALWGQLMDEQAWQDEHRQRVIPAGSEQFSAVRDTLNYHDLVAKMRASAAHRG